ENENGDPNSEVAIFGVVDPQLNEHIGQLNEEWVNPNKHRSTRVTMVMDPVLALKELLQYFNAGYEANHPGRKFQGMKILLADMPKYEAARIGIVMKGEFNLIIAQAQREYATPQESSCRSLPGTPAFLVAPVPFVDGAVRDKDKLNLQLASVELK